jgi:hypothetical protein
MTKVLAYLFIDSGAYPSEAPYVAVLYWLAHSLLLQNID